MAHLRQFAKSAGVNLKQYIRQNYISQDCPPQMKFLLEMFFDMNNYRQSNGFSANVLSLLEIQAWCEFRGVRLRPWELDVLHTLDVMMVKELNSSHDGSS